MAVLFEGECVGKVVNPEFGADGQGRPRVRWEMEATEGQHAGKRASYSGKLDPDNIKWTKRDMIAIGWKGKDVRTFVSDVKTAALVVPFTAEIASHDGRQWTSAKMNGALPLASLPEDKVSNVNKWFEAAGGDSSVVEDNDTPF